MTQPTKAHAQDTALRTLAFTRAMLHKDRAGMEALKPTSEAEALDMLTAAAGTILWLVDERDDVLDALKAAQLGQSQ